MVEVDTFMIDDKFGQLNGDITDDKQDTRCEEGQSDFGALRSFLSELKSKDRAKRDKAVDSMCVCVEKWAMTLEDPVLQRSLSLYLPVLVRLVKDCPFPDVRHRLESFLERLKNRNVNIPSPTYESPSTFIPMEEVVSITGELNMNLEQDIQERAFKLFERAFTMECRVSHLVNLMGYHPKYLAVFLDAHQVLMYGDGPLPRYIRVYIAILAAARYRCGYLVSILELEFHFCGGDVRWLTGLGNIPRKLYNLLKLNSLMAHQPWKIEADHVKELLIGHDSWSIAELTQASIIMAHYHSLAGFALGCGLTPEVDTGCGYIMTAADSGMAKTLSNPALCLVTDPIEASLSEGSVSGGDSVVSTPMTPPLPNVATKKVEHFIQGVHGNQGKLCDMLKTVDSESDEETVEQKDKDYEESVSGWTLGSDGKVPAPIPIPALISKYLDDPEFVHEDTLSLAKMRSSEYSWEDHGFPLVSQFYMEMAELLDGKFDVISNLTYDNVGTKKGVDTHHFRQAVWYYIQSIKGIRRDDYHYNHVNKLLSIPFKTYIKMVACYPEQVRLSNFDTMVYYGLVSSEKVHINLLILEARLQAELLYVSKAIMNHMK